jgi:hypothetical protein
MKLYTIEELAHDIWENTIDHEECDCRFCITLSVIEEYLK